MYREFQEWYYNRARYPGAFTETDSDKLDMLLEIFAPQIEEIRERRKAKHEQKIAEYNLQMAEFEERRRQAAEEARLKRDTDKLRAAKLTLEFQTLPDLGGLGSGTPERLAIHGGFSTVEEVREASDEQLLAIDGIGIKTLYAIRQRIHDHQWNEFTTEEGLKGSYCDGCKARTGFIAC